MGERKQPSPPPGAPGYDGPPENFKPRPPPPPPEPRQAGSASIRSKTPPLIAGLRQLVIDFRTEGKELAATVAQVAADDLEALPERYKLDEARQLLPLLRAAIHTPTAQQVLERIISLVGCRH